MSTINILQTKLFVPPLRPEYVSRPRLVQRLTDGLARQLTLVSAPAGFGKTTLLSEWVDTLSSSGFEVDEATPEISWLSLDESDNDPVQFLVYFIKSIDQLGDIGGKFGESTLKLVQSPRPPPMEAVLVSFINELSNLDSHFIVILDDYHKLDSPPVDEALEFLLEHLPPQIHLVIASRDDPQLPLARLRARNHLSELRAADLRFSTKEAADFLNDAMGLNLSVEQVSALESRTEGWIAGLQLAALSMQGRHDTASFIQSFTGTHHFVLDYLMEEVLEKQSESVQQFLVSTSILDRLSAPVCDAITGRQDGQATLEYLEEKNLFIVPLDNDRRWYRYHHLFAELLQQRLTQLEKERVSALHLQASGWFRDNGYAEEAIEHALGARDYRAAADLIGANADSVWRRGEHRKFRRWLAGLPPELLAAKPELSILQAWELFTSGQQGAAERNLNAAENAMNEAANADGTSADHEAPSLSQYERRMLMGRIATIRAFLAFYRGEADEILELSNLALEYLPEWDLTWRSNALVSLGDAYSFLGELFEASRIRTLALDASKAAGNTYMEIIAGMKLAVTLRQRGMLEAALDLCQEYFQMANESGLGQIAVTGWLLAIWGEILTEVNQLDSGLAKAIEGTELTTLGSDLASLGWSYLCLIRILYSTGDIEAAETELDKLETFHLRHPLPTWILDQLALWQVRIWLAKKDNKALGDWVQSKKLDPSTKPSYQDEGEWIALARILITQKKWAEAIALLDRLAEAVEERGHVSRFVEISLLRALAYHGGGSMEPSMEALAGAIERAEPAGFVRIFVDEGEAMKRLLVEAGKNGFSSAYLQHLVAAFSNDHEPLGKIAKDTAGAPSLVEPLSDRELEVLELIALGLTNREVAERLFLSLNTIKVHTRNIYGKLGVNNRTQAVAQARDLQLLSE